MSASGDPVVQKIIQRAKEFLNPETDSVQAFMRSRESSGVSFEEDKLKSAESAQRTDITVRVIKNGKVGMSVTTDPKDIEGVVQRALEAAEFGSSANYTMPTAQELTSPELYDPNVLPLAKSEMIHMGEQMMGMIKSYNDEIKTGAELNKALEESQFANSAGAAYAETSTNLVVGVGGQLVRGTDILFAGHWVVQKNRTVDPEDIAEKAIEYFRMAESTASITTGEYPVIFTPEGLAALVMPLGLGLDGKNVLLGASPLKGRLGQQIADPRFSLTDDPHLAYGARSSAFDEDGVPRQPLPLVENGVLRNFIYDLDTAAKAGTAPTGHGTNRRATNLVIAAGDTPLEEMIKGVKEGLMVNDFLGLGQGNPINGEFAANVALGYKIEEGKITGRVKNVMLAGNAYTALKNIVAISIERDWMPWFNCLAPHILVKGLSVSAK